MFNFFGRRKKETLKQEYDKLLIYQIDKAKIDWDQSKENEKALYDGAVDMRMLQAQTKLNKAKYMYLYREARRRGASGHMQTHVIKVDY